MKLIMSSGIYEMFCNHKNFYIGKQPEPFPGTDTVRRTVLPKTVDVVLLVRIILSLFAS